MQSCPNIDALIEISAGTRAADDAVLAHAATCERCQSDLELLGGLRAALKPGREVPEALIERVMAALPDPAPEPEPASSRPGWALLDRGMTFALGTTTVAAALMLGSPDGGAGSMLDLALFSSAVGLVVTLVESKVYA